MLLFNSLNIITKIIANIYIIERGNYENVGISMIVTTLISFFMPTIVILLFLNPFAKKTQNANATF